MTEPRALPPAWRERAALLRQHGATEAAQTANVLADELELALREQGEELFNLEQAAVISGFSADHLGREVRAGRIPNRGRAELVISKYRKTPWTIM